MGSAAAGVLEIGIFHPVDTAAKRLMSNTTNSLTFSRVVFGPSSSTWSASRKLSSLFPGLSFALGYKVLQRIYKFGGQPLVTESLASRLTVSKPLLHAIAGSLVGIGEVVLLPLDVLKIKMQTNPETLRGRSLARLFKEERLVQFYRGSFWTAARNAPGSFTLFGGNALVKHHLFGLEDFAQASLFQNFVASTVGGVASIAVASPMDVIKTRVQTRPFGNMETGSELLRRLLQEEGVRALFKGIVPKTLIVAPKLVFAFTVAQTLISEFERLGS
jgi:hypothetical protein